MIENTKKKNENDDLFDKQESDFLNKNVYLKKTKKKKWFYCNRNVFEKSEIVMENMF